MEEVEFLGVTINMFGEHEVDEFYNLGSVTLGNEGREYILDISESSYNDDSGDLEIECKLEVDKDIFEECEYDLTPMDLHSPTLTAEIYVDGTFSNVIDKMSLFVKLGGMTKAIDLEEE